MGNSGRIDFPEHMKTIHQDWLDDAGTDTIEASMVDKMNSALGSSPFGSMSAYDPATAISAMETAVGGLNTLIDALNYSTDWTGTVDTAVAKVDAAVMGDTALEADIAAFEDYVQDRVENEVLPRFQAGMQDVNAVMSSAFVVGQAIIEGMATRDVTKYGGEVRGKNFIQRNDFILKSIDLLSRNQLARIELEGKYVHYKMEKERMNVAAGKEKKDTENNVLIQNAKWDLEVFSYGCNLLSAIGGGTFIPNINSPSTGQSALAGALSGAALGSQLGGGTGALIGGGIGGLLGGLS